MKVAFWNGVSSLDGVTNYVAAIGTILTLEYNCEVVLGSNYISNHMLQDCFSSKMLEEGMAHAPYRLICGSQEYYDALWNMKRSRQGDVLEIPMDRITIIFPPDMAEKNMFYYDVPKTTFYLLDLAGENCAAFQNSLEEAELIVVFLPQDVAEIQKFFNRFSSLIPKAFFVIEEVQRTNRLFYRKIVAEYGISHRNIGFIPHSKEYRETCEEGKLESFMKRNQATKNPQYSFVSGVKSIAKFLYEFNNHETVKEYEDENKL